MTARDKLNEAAFWLDKIIAPFRSAKPGQAIMLSKNALQEWKAYLGSFLTSMKSIPDYLLEDYNFKHSLGISLTEKLNPHTFETRVKELKDTDKRSHALDFLKWWKTRIKDIKNDSACSFLIKLRDIAVHRQRVQPSVMKATLGETAIVHGWFFESYEEEDVLTMCDKYYTAMRKFVEEANQFL